MKITTCTKVNFNDLNEDQQNIFRQAEQKEFYAEIMEAGYKLAIEDYNSSANSNTDLYVEDPENIKDEEIEEAAKELGEIDGALFVERKSEQEDWESVKEMAAIEAAEEELLEWQNAQASEEEILQKSEALEGI